ncbi:MAG: DUF2141 domain-containing protein [Tannerella sp.]|nr:DUF2141 domain-containing protein [Tannerella sp.]
MKTLRHLGWIVTVCMCTGMVCKAQTADVTVVVRGIKEVKGNILVAAGDRTDSQDVKYGMIEVTSKDSAVYVLKEVPVGRHPLYVYQDMNGNHQLDMDENRIPVEPCYRKEKMDVKEGANRIEVRLVNVKEMMGAKN